MEHGESWAKEYLKGANERAAMAHVCYGARLAEEMRDDDALGVAVGTMIVAFDVGVVGEMDEAEREMNERSRSNGTHWVRGAYRCVTRPDLGPVYVVRSWAGFPATVVMLASEY